MSRPGTTGKAAGRRTVGRRHHAIVPLVLMLCCTSGPTPPTFESLAGIWPVRTINGSPPPAIISQANGHTVRVRSDTLSLSDSGTFMLSGVTADSSMGPLGAFIVIDIFAGGGPGTFTLSGNTMTLTFRNDHSSTTAAIRGNALSFTRAGSTYVFQKQ